MNGRANPAITTLVRAVQRRLWLQNCLNPLYLGLWIAAGLMLAIGVWHLFVSPHPSARVLGLPLVPVCIALLVGLLGKRPSNIEAAQCADQWFDGKTLITSAWEHQHKTPVPASPATRVLLQRAQRAAGQWLPGVAARHPLRWPGNKALLVLTTLTGLFLLQLPGKTVPAAPQLAAISGDPDIPSIIEQDTAPFGLDMATDPTPDTVADSALNHETSAAGGNTQAVLGENAGSPKKEPTIATETPAPQIAQDNGMQPAPGTMNMQQPSSNSPPGEPMDTDAAYAASGLGNNDKAGSDAARQRTLPTPGTSPELKVEAVAITRRPGTSLSAGNGMELASPNPNSTAGSPVTNPLPAAEHSGTPYRADLRPAMRAYVTRYLAELGSSQ